MNLCLCRVRKNNDWLGPHQTMHQAASSSKTRKYFLDEWRGKGKFTRTFRVHLRGTDSTLVIKMFKTCFCKFDEDPRPHKKHQLKSASGPAPPLLTHLAKLGMADYTSQGQTHFGWRLNDCYNKCIFCYAFRAYRVHTFNFSPNMIFLFLPRTELMVMTQRPLLEDISCTDNCYIG